MATPTASLQSCSWKRPFSSRKMLQRRLNVQRRLSWNAGLSSERPTGSSQRLKWNSRAPGARWVKAKPWGRKWFYMRISCEINCARRNWFSPCWRGGRFSALGKRGERVVHGRKREKAQVEYSSQELTFKQQMQHKVECIVSIFNFCSRLKTLCRSTIVPNTICPALKWRQRSWSRGLRKQPLNLWKQLSSSGTPSALVGLCHTGWGQGLGSIQYQDTAFGEGELLKC